MKRCSRCAEKIQDAALVCRFCGASAPPAPPIEGWIKIAGVLAVLVLVTYACQGDRAASPAPAETAAAAPAPLKPEVVAQCRELIARATRKGVIKARPKPDRLNVEDRLWAALPADAKDGLVKAVACEVWGQALPPGDLDGVVVYGHRSGKRIQMFTRYGMVRE